MVVDFPAPVGPTRAVTFTGVRLEGHALKHPWARLEGHADVTECNLAARHGQRRRGVVGGRLTRRASMKPYSRPAAPTAFWSST